MSNLNAAVARIRLMPDFIPARSMRRSRTALQEVRSRRTVRENTDIEDCPILQTALFVWKIKTATKAVAFGLLGGGEFFSDREEPKFVHSTEHEDPYLGTDRASLMLYYHLAGLRQSIDAFADQANGWASRITYCQQHTLIVLRNSRKASHETNQDFARKLDDLLYDNGDISTWYLSSFTTWGNVLRRGDRANDSPLLELRKLKIILSSVCEEGNEGLIEDLTLSPRSLPADFDVSGITPWTPAGKVYPIFPMAMSSNSDVTPMDLSDGIEPPSSSDATFPTNILFTTGNIIDLDDSPEPSSSSDATIPASIAFANSNLIVPTSRPNTSPAAATPVPVISTTTSQDSDPITSAASAPAPTTPHTSYPLTPSLGAGNVLPSSWRHYTATPRWKKILQDKHPAHRLKFYAHDLPVYKESLKLVRRALARLEALIAQLEGYEMQGAEMKVRYEEWKARVKRLQEEPDDVRMGGMETPRARPASAATEGSTDPAKARENEEEYGAEFRRGLRNAFQ